LSKLSISFNAFSKLKSVFGALKSDTVVGDIIVVVMIVVVIGGGSVIWATAVAGLSASDGTVSRAEPAK
jgi:hypothetical protein